MNKTTAYLLFILIISIFACESKNRKEAIDSNILNVDEYEVELGEKLNSEEWNCDSIDEDVLCYPKFWFPLNQNSFSFFAQIDTTEVNNFFVLAKYDLNELEMSMDDYLKEVYLQLIQDTTEIFDSYSLKRLVYADQNDALYGEFLTKVDNQEFFTYTMYTVRDELLFDFSLKVHNSERDKYYSVFQNILYNYKSDEQYLFDFKKDITQIEIVDLTDLN